MNPMRVGRMTAALSLMVLGAGLLADNLAGTNYGSQILRFWPAALVALGLEYLIHGVTSDVRGGRATQFDVGAIALLLVTLAVVGTLQLLGRFVPWFPPLQVWGNLFDARATVSFDGTEVGEWSGSGRATYTASREATLDVTGPGPLQVRMKAGKIRVTGTSPDGQVHARAQFPVYGPEGEAVRSLAESLELEVEEGALPTITVNINAPTPLLQMGQAPTLEVQIPEGLDLNVRSDAGTITVQDVGGSATAETDAGAIVAERIAGNLSVKTQVGSIEIRDVEGRVEAHTGPGTITASDFAGGVLESDFGAIRVQEWEGPLEIRSNTGSVVAKTGAVLTGHLDISTDVGSIDLTLPAASSAEFYARTDVGSINVHGTDAIAVVRRDGPSVEARGTLGGGTQRVWLGTDTGRISIHLR